MEFQHKPTTEVITLNEEKEELQIHDHYNWRLPLLRVFFICLALTGLLGLYDLIRGYAFQVYDGVEIVLGLAAIPLLIYSLTQKTARTKIPLGDIRKIKKKSSLGVSRVQIYLTNGKVRDIFKSMSKQDLDFLNEISRLVTSEMRAGEQAPTAS